MIFVYLFGWIMAIILFPPDFSIHLKFDILEVCISVHILNVTLGHIVGGTHVQAVARVALSGVLLFAERHTR